MAAASVAEEEDARTLSLPPYSQMITNAISALNGRSETSRAAVSSYIESVYGEQLPASHDSLLGAHLSRMVDIGELVLVNNCYFCDGPNLHSVKRGRGRPPKARLPDQAMTASADPAAGQKRPRGRPPKPVDPSAPAKVPRPRGRPPKNPQTDGASSNGAGQVKRPRGRPPKVRPQFTEVGFV